MARSGSIRCPRAIAIVTLAGCAMFPVTRADSGPLLLVSARLLQRGAQLRLSIRTRGSPERWLDDPRAVFCLTLGPVRQVCLGGGRGSRVDKLDAAGRVVTVRPLIAAVITARRGATTIAFAMRDVGVRPGRLEWLARLRWRGPPCSSAKPCVSRVPGDGRNVLVVAPAPTGCTAAGGGVSVAGPPRSKEVALTFDDGPGQSTAAVLTTLEAEHAVATFFVVGEHVRGHEPLLRRMLRDGDALGNHSFSHVDLARDGRVADRELAETNALVGQVTGYAPCLFRAPFGDVSPALIADAHSQGLMTIGWNVDPRDWALPGVRAIVTRVLTQTRPGSIVLMHDGGGPRSETVAALPRIIAALLARGLRLVTVPELLGLRRHAAVSLRALLSADSPTAA